MANGTKQLFIASPQPGTTNLPYPIGPVPAFIPVGFTCTDTNAAAMLTKTTGLVAQLAELQIELVFIDADLFAIVAQTGRMADQAQAMSTALSATKIAVLSQAAAQSRANVITAMQVSNQVQTNNYFVAASKETPVMPPVAAQIKDTIVAGGQMRSALAITSATQGYISTGMSTVSNWIKDTGPYKTAVKWLEDASDSILKLLPTSVQSLFTSSSAATGTKAP